MPAPDSLPTNNIQPAVAIVVAIAVTLTTTMSRLPAFTLSAILLFLNACAIQSPTKPIQWQEDKIKHFTATTFISAAAASHEREFDRDCPAAGRSILFTMSIGAAKETYDKYIKKTFWDWEDMTWNLIGSTLGAAVAAHCY